MSRITEIIVGIDLGTTNIKAIAVDRSGRVIETWSQPTNTRSGDQGRSEQDPDLVTNLVKSLVEHFQSKYQVQALGFSSAMHAFLVVDGRDRPMSSVWTWMDRRAVQVARDLRAEGLDSRWRERTGTPLHSMSPAVKWLYWRQKADRPEPGTRPVSLKDYVLYRLTGIWATDYSTAAATGMARMDGCWDDEILRRIGLESSLLPKIDRLSRVVDGSVPIVLGGSDGALAHLALRVRADDGAAVLSLGTSGALRVTTGQPPRPLPHDLFCYLIEPGIGYLMGEAISNVGNLLAWVGSLYGVSPQRVLSEGVQALKDRRRVPFMMPYLYGERSPWWREDLTAGWFDILSEHTAADFMASAVLSLLGVIRGMSRNLRDVLNIQRIQAGSGLFQWPGFAQLMADVLERTVTLSVPEDASVWGAAQLARTAVSWPEIHDSRPSPEFHPSDRSLAARADEVWDRIVREVASLESR